MKALKYSIKPLVNKELPFRLRNFRTLLNTLNEKG